MKYLLTGIFLVIFSISFGVIATSAQCPATMPAGTQCILQATANQAAEDHRVRVAVEAENVTLKDSLTTKDQIIDDNKATAAKNEADLKRQLTDTQTKLAETTGELIGANKTIVDQRAIITAMIPMLRQKKTGLIVF